MSRNYRNPITAGISLGIPDPWVNPLLDEMHDDANESGEFFDTIPQILADLNFFQSCLPASLYIRGTA
jgi:hypothetical protein